MGNDKLCIPMPDDQTIQSEIKHIVSASAKQRESFFSYLKSIYQQIGVKRLFLDRSEFVLTLLTAVTLTTIFTMLDPINLEIHDIYSILFLTSPILFLAVSIYTYVNKIRNGTYEVEMSCKYNVYQTIAFRMLAFSVVAILINTVTVFLVVTLFEGVQFIRALMISMTALFAFSVLFLYTMMKRRSTVVAVLLIVGWIVGNLALRYVDSQLYFNVLINMPLYVHTIVLVSSLYGYLNYLNALLHLKHTEGAY